MLTKLHIENFKALTNVDLEFTAFTMLIGENACGKSSLLQALDLLRSFALRDIDEYLVERDWLFEDLKSQFGRGSSKPVIFRAVFQFKELHYPVEWYVSLDYKNDNWLITEIITDLAANNILLNTEKGKTFPEELKKFSLRSSALKLYDTQVNPDIPRALLLIKRYCEHSISLELLSPERMRSKGNRGTSRNIGSGGEMLAAYLNGLGIGQRNALDKIVANLVGTERTLRPWVKGQPGWIELRMEEQYKGTATNIKSAHTSDGLLRLYALAGIINGDQDPDALFNLPQERGMMLIDEIEDGLNPYIAGEVIAKLKESAADTNQQYIITTHSPVIVNALEPEEIIFMWRDKAGHTQARRMFSTKAMKETLELLNPGEVWMAYNAGEIIARLVEQQPGGSE